AAPFALGSIILVGVAIAAAKSASGATRARAARERGGLSMLKNRRELIIPVAAAFIERFTVGCIIVTFALFAHRAHGLSDRSIGLLFALLTFTFALSMYPVGRLTERIPRAYVLACGAALYCGALATLGYVPTMGLPLVMIVAGASSSMLYAPTLSYASALSGSESRSKVMALINAAGCLGMLVGPMLAGVTSAMLRGSDDPIRGYRAVFLLAAFSVALWLLASLRWLFRQLRAERPNLVCPMRTLVPPPEQVEKVES
ncbi:MAG TPA: MFS transporter, partial [Blastocatellia bacterium]|nr:MFS transporter [Blastocatellia bacterium]